MTLAMRQRVAEPMVKGRKLGDELDFGVGIAQGYATIGAIGFGDAWTMARLAPVIWPRGYAVRLSRVRS
jgi:class 3 adenylate cyclase